MSRQPRARAFVEFTNLIAGTVMSAMTGQRGQRVHPRAVAMVGRGAGPGHGPRPHTLPAAAAG
jgi:hypothetical protein